MLPRPFRVVARQSETDDTVTLGLQALDGVPLAFAPGQFSMLYAFGVGEAPISFSGGRDGVVQHTVREVGAVTRALCAARPGDMLGLRGPFGTGWGVDEAQGADVVIVAGGIGLAPLRPVIDAVLARRERYERVSVLVGARTPNLLLFQRDLMAWRSRFDLEVFVTVDAAGRDWRGDVGLVTDLVPRVPFEPEGTVAFICGPEVMMRFAAMALLDRGVRPEAVQISMERNMQCGVGHCGHCQFGPHFVCTDGPVFAFERVAPLLTRREV
jgi:NAD(P)H-flavin reductase